MHSFVARPAARGYRRAARDARRSRRGSDHRDERSGLQFRAVDAVVDLVEELALHTPLVIGLDDLLAADADVVAVGRVASVYVGPHQLVITAEIQPGDEISGIRLRQLVAELQARVLEAVPRASLVFLMPVVATEPQPELTPWDHDWLRRYPTRSRPSHEGIGQIGQLADVLRRRKSDPGTSMRVRDERR